MIIPVPLDSRRARERGFNQALIIAKMLKRTDKKNTPPIVPLLRKVKKTLPQSQLRREERLNNLAGAFTIRKQRGIRGKQILLVDDIFTTGSTINECTKVLKEAGADRVDFFTIARSHLS
ncbi:MAG: ComF family protein [Candidatus Omnitrophica bacterium]|nr:ComF family protein [Candidatus Omnitrophota bacterium]